MIFNKSYLPNISLLFKKPTDHNIDLIDNSFKKIPEQTIYFGNIILIQYTLPDTKKLVKNC